jgi:hypothetical protein
MQNDSVHGEYAERIYAHMENTQGESCHNMPRDINLSIFQLIKEQNEKTSDSLFIFLMGLNKQKNHFTLLTNRNCKHFRGKNRRFIASEEVTGRIFTIIDCIEASENFLLDFLH